LLDDSYAMVGINNFVADGETDVAGNHKRGTAVRGLRENMSIIAEKWRKINPL
jgi:hypothetical protein